MFELLSYFAKAESGATSAEYGMIALLVSVTSFAALVA
jgi:Flp pilus assembly pilin Flp